MKISSIRTTSIRIKAAFLIFALSVFSLAAAQQQPRPSNEQILKYYNEAKARGMSDEEIEKAAIASGFPVEEIARIRQQLSGVNQERLEEHVRETAGIREAPAVSPEQTLRVPSAEDTSEDLEVFGTALFSTGSATFEPNLRIATPINYIVGPDDELTVDLSGKYNEVFRLRVSPEGTVRVLNFPPIYVAGLTIDQAKQRIAARLGSAYSGGGVYTNIALTGIRSIRVTVTGQVQRPGAYTLSSLSTAFHALHVSGGPSANGSFRNIEVVRNNKVIRKIDLYKYIVDADASDNIMLEDQDVILIRPYDTRVTLEGEVKTPALFEALPNETLQKLISYAGGYTPDAYTYSIGYRRNTGKEFRVGQVSEADYGSFNLKSGDRFMVGRALDRFENRVTIEGAVFRSGDYALEPGLFTVKELILKADGLIENAFLNRGLIRRQNERLEPVTIAFDVRKLMNGEIQDIPLKRNDVVMIKSIQDLREVEHVSIGGEVIQGGEFEYAEGMTISDLIFLAGGFTHGGIPYRIEVSRRVKEDTLGIPMNQNVRLFELNIPDNLELTDEDRRFVLRPYDQVTVRRSPRYETQKQMYLVGEVVYPGLYTIQSNFERISDVIAKAGGLKPEAYIRGAQFRRRGNPVALDITSILKDPSLPSNLLLHAGDTLIIPRRLETVEITGQVLNPSVVNYDSHFRFKDYVTQAGGYTDAAMRKKVYVTYPNGRTDRTRRVLLFFRKNPPIEPGSMVVVPMRDAENRREPMSRSERIMTLSVISTMTVTLIRLIQDVVRNN